MCVGGNPGTEAGNKISGGEFGVIRDRLRDETLWLDAPDAPRLLIAVRVVTGDLIMADDFVVPIDDIQAAVRTHRHGDRPEEGVFAADEIVELLQAIAGTFAVLADRVDLGCDRIGDIHDAVEALWPHADIGQGETAEAGAAHLEVRRLDRELRLIGFCQTVCAARIEGVLVERHHRVAIVVGLLDEALAFARQHQAPDITGTCGGGLKEAAVGTEASHARAREIDLVAMGGDHRTLVEGALREPQPAERGARELVREEVRILHAEAREQDLALVGLAGAGGIAQEDDVVSMLDDRAVLVGSDGATHQGAFDVSFLRCVPGMTLMAPADENECRQMLYTAITLPGPAAVRYPRGQGPGITPLRPMQAVPVGQGEVRREGRSGLAILAFGTMVQSATLAADKLDATLINMRFIKPLDEQLVLSTARSHSALVTIEENVIAGGAGDAVLETLSAHGVSIPVLQLGIPDRFIEHGTRAENLATAGLDSQGIDFAIRAWRQLPKRVV